MEENQDTLLHQPNSFRKITLTETAKPVVTTLLNTLEPKHLRNSFKKEAKLNKLKENTKKSKSKRLTIEEMLTEIYRLKDLTFMYPHADYQMIHNLPDNTYDYYFAYFHAQKSLELEDTSDDKAEQLRNFVDLFNAYLEEQFNNEDMTLVGMVLNDMEEFAHYDGDFTELNDMMADYFLNDEDQLLNFFKISYANKYTKVLVKLKEFSNYLALICYQRNDYKTFMEIKDLYVDTLDDNYGHFEEEELRIKNLGSIKSNVKRELINRTVMRVPFINVRNELLSTVPRIEGGGLDKNNYAVILMSAIVMGIASIM